MFGFGRKDQDAAPARREVKASAAGRVIAWGTVGRNVWSARDTVSLTRSGFASNPVGFRAVKLIAEAAAAVPVVVGDGAARFEVHPVMDLLRRPNGTQGRAELFEALFGQLLLSGDAYLEAVGPEGVPLELHVLRSDRMSVVPGPDGWPAAYDYSVGGRSHRFKVGEVSPVLHIRSFHPLDDHYGLSPFQAAGSAIDVHNAASAWSKGLLDNAARPSGAIVHRGEAPLTQEQFDQLTAALEAHHQGSRNAGRPILLDGGLEWESMGLSPSDMEFQKTKEVAAREIAMAFGVPPMLLGIPGDATYANYVEANRAFYRLTVLPLVGRVSDAVARWLSTHMGEALDIQPDRDRIPALQAERDAEWQRIAQADFLTAAEKRERLGLPPLGDA
ncbi:phage portal protein [Jannaschia seohaensis]|uniref:HK97 family phage portal protein n=1 Tax=Jannaschia seohaensis TaxID=475081 RepID=A0A2Y9AMU3_9RHOB|nr:phage portal protein [Jannaschia seohaensis]PWJ19144.1 HK97 family phage portal protein [Jannaschia seohaensis]SSA45801.1 phage portal protein, HK97 family [Jannaschia seohaensis]